MRRLVDDAVARRESIVEQFGGAHWLDRPTLDYSPGFKFRLPKTNGMPMDAVSVL